MTEEKPKRIYFNDWQVIRKALDAAYVALGRPPTDNLPTEEWNLVGSAIIAYDAQSQWSCGNCQEKLDRSQEIRCLDCKMTLCERCAPAHFWPKGRPKSL